MTNEPAAPRRAGRAAQLVELLGVDRELDPVRGRGVALARDRVARASWSMASPDRTGATPSRA